MEIGQKEIGIQLNMLFTDEYKLYTKTRFANWKISEKNNHEIQRIFELQCGILYGIVDDIAEYIRSHGQLTLSSLKDFLKVNQMKDENKNFNNSMKIYQLLIADHEKIINSIKSKLVSLSENFNDRYTNDFVTGIIEQHERMVDMLGSIISEATQDQN